jgi:hypothetical protein
VGALVLGIVLAFVGRRAVVPREQRTTRSAILEELAALVRAHEAGEIGPKTYERSRRQLIVELARTLSPA